MRLSYKRCLEGGFSQRRIIMSSPQDQSDYPHFSDHQATWGSFCSVAKWVGIGVILTVILMAAFLTGDHRSIGL